MHPFLVPSTPSPTLFETGNTCIQFGTHIAPLTTACLFHFARSRDVAELRANMTFDPVKINLQQSQYQCEHDGRKSVCVKTEVCFAYRIKSEQQDLNSVAGEPLSILC